jgi:nitrilase
MNGPRPPPIVRGVVTIAAASAPFEHDVPACLARIRALLDAAREAGAGLVVLPESAIGGYVLEGGAAPGLPPALEPDGPEIARLIELAGDLVVCAGYTELGERGERYAAAVCVGDGEVLGRHRKVHLPPAERFAYTPGDAFAAFDTPAGRIGMLLCYDKLFPEAARALALDGAQVLCTLAAWPVDRVAPAEHVSEDRQTRHFDLADQMRAIENQVFAVASNQVGSWGPVDFLGGAKVVDPDGAVLARTGAWAGLAVARADLAQVEGTRAVIDHLADRRPAAYGTASVTARTCAGSSLNTGHPIPPSSSACWSGSPTAVLTTAAPSRSTATGSATGG